MAEHGVLPHLVIVFGRPFREGSWRAFHPEKKPALHHANLIEVEGAAGKHKLALLCVRHPAARVTKKGTPEWLLALNEMRELLGRAPR